MKTTKFWNEKFVKAFMALACVALVSGCFATRTLTLVPGSQGVVVSQSTGMPMAGVEITESSTSFPSDYQVKTYVTDAKGAFHFPAITDGQVTQLMAPGAGIPVSRTLIFDKKNYIQRRCTITDMSLFSEPRELIVGLLEVEPTPKSQEQLPHLMEVSQGVECSVTNGDAVTEEHGQARLLSVQVK